MNNMKSLNVFFGVFFYQSHLDNEFRFNDMSTHEDHILQNVICIWFNRERDITRNVSIWRRQMPTPWNKHYANKNSAEGVIAPAGAKVTGATIRMWFLAVLTWKTGLKKMWTKCLVGHIYSRPVPFPLMAISSALTFRIIQLNDNGTLNV